MKKIFTAAIVLALVFAVSGCAGMSQTEQSTVTGTVIGAGAGGIIGAMAGNAGMGAGIGAATGLVGGYLYGKHKEAEQEAYNRGRADAAQGR